MGPREPTFLPLAGRREREPFQPAARCVPRRGLAERCGRGAFSSREAVDVAHRHRGRSRGRFPAYLAGRGARRFPRFPVRRRAAAGAAGKLLPRAVSTHVVQAGTRRHARGWRRRWRWRRPLRRLLRAALRRAPLSARAHGQRGADRDLPGDVPSEQDQSVLRQRHRSRRGARRPALYRPRQRLCLPRPPGRQLHLQRPRRARFSAVRGDQRSDIAGGRHRCHEGWPPGLYRRARPGRSVCPGR